MRRQRDAAEVQLRKMQGAGDRAWDDLKTGFDKAWDDISAAFRTASDRFR